jgi:hypothetical protein
VLFYFFVQKYIGKFTLENLHWKIYIGKFTLENLLWKIYIGKFTSNLITIQFSSGLRLLTIMFPKSYFCEIPGELSIETGSEKGWSETPVGGTRDSSDGRECVEAQLDDEGGGWMEFQSLNKIIV